MADQLAWTDITDLVLGPDATERLELAPWQQQMLTMTLDNTRGSFTPRRRVTVHVSGRRPRGPLLLTAFDEPFQYDRPAQARRSRMHAAYRRRRR